jgi:pimeloyl-ACP methyl ester carboxylesterase
VTIRISGLRASRSEAGVGRPRWLTSALVTLVALGGCLGLAVGAGIALPWVVKSGLGAVSLAALAALALGVAAVVVVARTVWRGTRGWLRLVASVGLLAAALLTTYCVGIALAATVVPPTPAPTSPPTELAGASEVRLTSADGAPLAGWYRPGRSGAAVILLHGSGSQRADVLPQAVVLANQGFGVLLLDARGHGRSGGRAMDLGWYGETDIAGALTYLAAQPGVDPHSIGLLGMSMGGEEAIGTAGVDPRVAAVVAEGVTGRTADDKAWLSDVYGLAGRVQNQLDRVTYGLADLLTDAPHPVPLRESVTTTRAPTLLVVAGQVDDERSVAGLLAHAAPDHISVWVVEGAGHGGALGVAPAEWEQRVVGFFSAALRGNTGGS